MVMGVALRVALHWRDVTTEQLVCTVCDYEVMAEELGTVGASTICPECGADLTKPGAVVRGRRMSHEAASRLWWIVGVAWFLSTAVWIARWIW